MYKLFIKYSIFLVIFIYGLSYIFHKMDNNITDSDVLRKYQIEKIKTSRNNQITTIFVGDSSCGHGINALYFSELSKNNSINLSLAGNFGLAGSLNMIKVAKKHLPLVKNVVIMQTLDIWRRDFSTIGYFDTLYNNSLEEKYLFEYMKYLFNPKEIYWNISYYIGLKENRTIDISYDYFLQTGPKFSNETKSIKPNDTIEKNINIDNLKTLVKIDEECKRMNLNCIYIHSPIHQQLFDSYHQSIWQINHEISRLDLSMKVFLNEDIKYSDSQMGNAIDHIDENVKNINTKKYFEILQTELK